jgi:DNA-binding MarR family transcriptional regulator/ribosomal protein S18 acetylase RimI-like enzyme
MDSDQVEQVRRFNRLVTRRIGALSDDYLSRGRPLGEARLIFEVGAAGGMDLGRLRAKLGLDSGYMSRLLRSLEAQEMIEVRRKPGDGRAREVLPTSKGRKEFAAYDSRSAKFAQSMLSPLGDAQRGRLVAAMAEVERLIRASFVTIAVESPRSTDGRWCREQYFAELARRFDGGFDVSTGDPSDSADLLPPSGSFVVARLDGEPVGCGGLKTLDAGTGEIKRVWTAASARGIGVAWRIMQRLEERASEMGFSVVRLDTNRTLTEAQALYRKLGYHEIGRYNDNLYAQHFFEKRL